MSRKLVSYPYEDKSSNGLLSYYVFYQDNPPNRGGGRDIKHMTGVNFANKAKVEIHKLRQQILELEKDINYLTDRNADLLHENMNLRFNRPDFKFPNISKKKRKEIDS